MTQLFLIDEGTVASGGDAVLASWSFVIALLSLLWTALWSWWTFKRGHIRDYWFKEVIAPRTVVPLLAFSEEWLVRIRALQGSTDGAHAAQELGVFGEAKDKLLAQIWISKFLFEKLYSETCDQFDVVEDSLVTASGVVFLRNELGDNVSAADFDDVARALETAVLRVLRLLATTSLKVR
jgi:hypothetical protein